MSRRQWKRLDVVERVREGQLSRSEGAQALGLSLRQMRRLVNVKEGGKVPGARHGNFGRPPANRLGDEVREKILTLAVGRYAGFNDHHLTEKLNDVEGIAVSRATVHRLLRTAQQASPRRRRARKHHKRRERKAQEGLMLLWDGSSHAWLEERGPRLCLMGAVDDATGALMPGAHFVSHESSVGYLRVLLAICQGKGVPQSIYMDRHSCLKRNDDHWSLDEQLRGEQEKTQVGRALAQLDVQCIFALSPQAKGRVERLWGTLQDRLVSEMRLATVSSLEAANTFLAGYIDEYNAKFARPAKQRQSAWQKLQADALRICALQYPAKVGNDNTVRHQGMLVDIAPGAGGRSWAGMVVTLTHLLDGSLRVYKDDHRLPATCAGTLPPTHTVQRRRPLPTPPKPPTKKRKTFAQIAAQYPAAPP